MGKSQIQKIKQAWEPNRISHPVKSELYLNIIDQVAKLFSAGEFYYYIINFDSLQMEYVDQRIESVLGIKPEECTIDNMLGLIHPEDLEQMHKKEAKAVDFILNQIKTEDILDYKVVYLMRVKHTKGNYKTILHQSKTLTLSEDGKAQQVLGIHTDVTYLNLPIDHKISFIGDRCSSYYSLPSDENYRKIEDNIYNTFTAREKEILSYIANGKSFTDIAVILNVSPHTINTHKKNILRKTDCKNTTELVARCVRLGII